MVNIFGIHLGLYCLALLVVQDKLSDQHQRVLKKLLCLDSCNPLFVFKLTAFHTYNATVSLLVDKIILILDYYNIVIKLIYRHCIYISSTGKWCLCI